MLTKRRGLREQSVKELACSKIVNNCLQRGESRCLEEWFVRKAECSKRVNTLQDGGKTVEGNWK